MSAGAAALLPRFRIEASSDSLVLEDDPALAIYDRSRVTFGSDEYVFVTLSREGLFEPEGIAQVSTLTAAVAGVEGVRSALSMTEVPLFRSKGRPNLMMLMMRGVEGQPTLTTEGVDLEAAREELTGHELFRGTLVSVDGRTAAIVATFDQSEELTAVTRDYLAMRAERREASEAERAQLEPAFAELRARYRSMETARKDERIRIVRRLREVAAEQAGGQEVHVAGLPTIIIDMVDAIDEDLRTFGLASIGFVAAFLLIVFRRLRWVILPLAIGVGTALWVLALFVLEDKRLTVVTGNIPSLLLIIGLAHALHIIIRFQEDWAAAPPGAELWPVLRGSLRRIIVPCFYTALTTGVGFASLIVAGIRPIKDFGIHMSVGVGLAFALSFLVFPAALALWPKPAQQGEDMAGSSQLMRGLARWSLRLRWLIAALVVLITVASVLGIQRIGVDSSFVDYFREGSPVRASLQKIDEELGGTTQLEVILKAEDANFFKTKAGLEAVKAAEATLRSHEREVGNVVGLAAVVAECLKIAQAAGMPPNELLLLNRFVPKLGREQLSGYVNEDWSRARIVARVRDTTVELDRAGLLAELQSELDAALADKPLTMELTGMFVLFTNMLGSLTGSQVQTASAVFGLIFVMMVILLRNLRAAALCMIPNALPILFVLGLMGWLGIPLDMATVMIASISLGIAIDGTIHYTVRFRDEYAQDGDAAAALERSHASIGVAIFYTTLTSIAGFWVLTLSNFKPNLYFGLFTGVAMLASMFAALTVLPVSLAWVRPFAGPSSGPQTGGAEPAPEGDSAPGDVSG